GTAGGSGGFTGRGVNGPAGGRRALRGGKRKTPGGVGLWESSRGLVNARGGCPPLHQNRSRCASEKASGNLRPSHKAPSSRSTIRPPAQAHCAGSSDPPLQRSEFPASNKTAQKRFLPGDPVAYRLPRIRA